MDIGRTLQKHVDLEVCKRVTGCRVCVKWMKTEHIPSNFLGWFVAGFGRFLLVFL